MDNRNWRWVSRDTSGEFVDVWANDNPPNEYAENGNVIFDGGRYAGVCHDEFLSLTGIDIQPGTCRKVEFTAKVLEE